MPEWPEESWDTARFLTWLEPGFAYLGEQWRQPEEGEGDDRPEPASWEDCRAGFLAALDTTGDEIEAQPSLRVLQLLVWHVDNQVTSEDDRRDLLLDESQRSSVIEDYVQQWRQEQPDSSGGEQDGLQYVEGRGWMRYDEASGQWVIAEAGQDEPQGADGAGQSDEEQPGTPEEVSARVAEEIGAPALEALMAQFPELASLPSDQLSTLVSEVISERLAAVTGGSR